MGLTRMFLFMFLFVLFIQEIRADCASVFSEPTHIKFNDSTLFEKGEIVHDFSGEIENETLSFVDHGCDRALEINGTQLLLKQNLLEACDIGTFSCVLSCKRYPNMKNSLRVEITRVSRGKLKFLKSEYFSNVSESANIGKEVFEFHSTEVTREDCTNVLSEFLRIQNESEFSLTTVTVSPGTNIYKIKLNQPLDYDSGKTQYNLTITAYSQTQLETLSNSTTLTVSVIDVDDMDPVFDHDIYTLHIPEENTSIQNVSLKTNPIIFATDKDAGAGKQELYYRFEDGSNAKGCFMIDAITGEISTKCVLDREKNSSYIFIIKGVQRNTDLRSCTATLSIIVDDVNDHAPEFQKTNFKFNVPEHSSKGTSIARVTAEDKDEGENAEVGYMILQPYNATFSVEDQGIIRVVNPSSMDRESGNGTIAMRVIAYDRQSKNQSEKTATVVLTLLDINDVAPVFESKEYTFPLPLKANLGHIVGTVKAHDGDEENTPNSEITYRLEQTLSSDMFSINSISGEIKIEKAPPVSSSLIELAAIAEDHGDPSLQTYAQILLSRTLIVGKTVQFTVPESKDAVLKRKADIQRDISKILNITVFIDEIGEVEGDKHSCYLNITAKYKNSTDVSGDVLQGSVLQHMSAILALFSVELPERLVSTRDSFPPEVIALIAICGVMFIGTIILIGVIYNTTRRFEKYKQLNDHLTRRSSLYESQEMKIQMNDEQTSDYNGSINGSHDLQSLHNATTGELKEGVVSAFTNPVYNVDDETTVKLDPAEEEAQQTLNDLADHLDAEDTNILPVDSYNPSENDIEVEIKPDYDAPNDYVNAPLQFGENSASGDENIPNSSKSLDVPEDYPNEKKDLDSIKDEDNNNEQNEDEDEPNPDYEVKAVRFSTQVLDTDENKFEPLKEKDDAKKDEESGEDIDDREEDMQEDDEEDGNYLEGIEQGKEDDFGDGIEIERTDEEILSPNETLRDDHDSEEDNTPHFAFDTKM